MKIKGTKTKKNSEMFETGNISRLKRKEICPSSLKSLSVFNDLLAIAEALCISNFSFRNTKKEGKEGVLFFNFCLKM